METLLSPFTPPPDNPPDWFEKYRYYIFGGLLVMFGAGVYLILTPPKTLLTGPGVQTAGGGIEVAAATDATASPASGKLVVDIAGGVVKPGVYWLDAGKIIEDAINAAGGFARSVDMTTVAHTINRAQELTNHGKIYIPKLGDTAIAYTPPSAPASSATGTSAKININSADNTELELLPGIGPVLAQRIVDYRLQSGPFKSIDDLQQVPGIGDKLFEQLKNLVTI